MYQREGQLCCDRGREGWIQMKCHSTNLPSCSNTIIFFVFVILIQTQIRSFQPRHQMIVRSDRLPQLRPHTIKPLLRTHHLTRHRLQHRFTHRMTKIRNTIPILSSLLFIYCALREYNPMNRAFEKIIRPVTQQIPDIDQYRGTGIGFGAWRRDGDRCPGCGVAGVSMAVGLGRGREDLEAGLSWALEEEGYGAVI